MSIPGDDPESVPRRRVSAAATLPGVAAVRWPRASTYGAEVPAAWFELALELVRATPGFSSVQSAAAAQVLTDLFGPIGFTDRTHERRGIPARWFESFLHAAREAAISRLYGGIHFVRAGTAARRDPGGRR